MSWGKAKIDQADRFFSLWIRNRDKWTCQRCLKQYTVGSQSLHNSHFVGRRKEATRFEPKNCCALCFGCHHYLTSHPLEHYNWQVKRIGQDMVDKLELLSNTYHKKDRKVERLYWQARLKKDFGIIV